MILTVADYERAIAGMAEAGRLTAVHQLVARWACSVCGSGANPRLLVGEGGIVVRCGFQSCAPALRFDGSCPTCGMGGFCLCEDCSKRGICRICVRCGDLFINDGELVVLRLDGRDERALSPPLRESVQRVRAGIQQHAARGGLAS